MADKRGDHHSSLGQWGMFSPLPILKLPLWRVNCCNQAITLKTFKHNSGQVSNCHQKCLRDIHSPLVTSDLALSPNMFHHCPARGGAEPSSAAGQNESYLFCAQDFARKLLSPIDQIA